MSNLRGRGRGSSSNGEKNEKKSGINFFHVSVALVLGVALEYLFKIAFNLFTKKELKEAIKKVTEEHKNKNKQNAAG